MNYFEYPEDENGIPTQVVVLQGLSEPAWDKLLSISESRYFSENEILVEAGERDDSVYFLAQGQVSVVAPSIWGKEKVLATINEGAVFGEIAFFDQMPRTATIRASTDGSVLRITREAFDQFSIWEPAAARQLLFDLGKTIALRLRALN